MIDTLLRVLPALLSLVQTFLEWSIGREKVEQGRLEAVAEAAQRLNRVLARATSAQQEAAEAHAKDPTDDAFDPEFRRR